MCFIFFIPVVLFILSGISVSHFVRYLGQSFCPVSRSVILFEAQNFALRSHYAASNGKLYLYLLILFDILPQTNYFCVVFLIFLLFFQLLHLFLFLICSIFHLYFPLLQNILHICCYFLHEFLSYFFLNIPSISISHFLILVF